ncbi:MAG: DUF5368 family protein [Pseudolabrys sp.]|nr:DUF5368 family protein [Pseudolabrys sp.]
MKDLDVFVLVAVFQEMLGWLFWPLVILVVLGLVGFVGVIVRDRGIYARRFVIAELVGVAGGFFGIWLMLTITSSQLSDIGGPIDWVLMVVIWLAGAIGAAVVAYIGLAALDSTRRSPVAQRAPPLEAASRA